MEEFNLLEHLPPVLRSVKELMEICRAEEPEFEKAYNALRQVVINLYVKTANEKGIARFEAELGIVPSLADSLDARKERVIALSLGNSIYTMRWLKKWIKNIGGDIVPTIEDYTLSVSLPAASDYNSLFDALKIYIPANINLTESLKLTRTDMNLLVGAAIRFSMKRTFEGEAKALPTVLTDGAGNILTDARGNYLIAQEATNEN